MENRIQIIDGNGVIKAEAYAEGQVVLAWKGEYGEGDRIVFRAGSIDTFYVLRADDVMDESFVYLTREEIVFDIPFEEKNYVIILKLLPGKGIILQCARLKSGR